MGNLLDSRGEPVVPTYVLGFYFEERAQPPMWLSWAASQCNLAPPQLMFRVAGPQTGTLFIQANETEEVEDVRGGWHYRTELKIANNQPKPRVDIGWVLDGTFIFLVEKPKMEKRPLKTSAIQ